MIGFKTFWGLFETARILCVWCCSSELRLDTCYSLHLLLTEGSSGTPPPWPPGSPLWRCTCAERRRELNPWRVEGLISRKVERAQKAKSHLFQRLDALVNWPGQTHYGVCVAVTQQQQQQQGHLNRRDHLSRLHEVNPGSWNSPAECVADKFTSAGFQEVFNVFFPVGGNNQSGKHLKSYRCL